MIGSLMPGDQTILLAECGKVVSYEQVKQAFQKERERNREIVLAFEREIFLMKLLDRIYSNKRA